MSADFLVRDTNAKVKSGLCLQEEIDPLTIASQASSVMDMYVHSFSRSKCCHVLVLGNRFWFKKRNLWWYSERDERRWHLMSCPKK